MNQIPIYQHPFVDVFKITKLADWVNCHKEGDVQDAVWDQNLAKNFIRIQGTSSSSNYIQVPATKFLPKKALGLTGKYIYLLLNRPDGKNCIVHLDYMVNETRLTKVSLSNIYKDFKNLNGSSLQIPLTIQPDRWTLVCIAVGDLLDKHKILAPTQAKGFFLRSLQICSTVNVRGVFTSDIQYQVQTLPKEMQFKLPKNSDWFAHYSWFQYPSSAVNEDTRAAEPKENSSVKANKSRESKPKGAAVAPERRVSKIDARRSGIGKGLDSRQSKSKVKFEADNQAGGTTEHAETTEATSERQIGEAEEVLYPDPAEEEDEYNGKIEKTMKEIEALKEDYNYNLQSKCIEQTAEITLYQENTLYDPKFDPKNPNLHSEKFVLKPNPIMRLDRVVGWHPHNTCNQIYFNQDPKLSKEIIFSQANLMLGFYPPLQKQRLFYERHTNNIDQMFMLRCAQGLNYAITVCKSLEPKSRDNELTVWSLDSLETTNAQSQSLVTFKPPLKTIQSVSVSCGAESEYICISGKDHQIRDVVLVYRFSDLVKYQKAEIVARQLSDFETYSVKFNQQVPNSIIACGKENIKFYKIKSGHLPGQAVMLNNTARGKIFNNSIVQKQAAETQKQGAQPQKVSFVFVTTVDGLLYFVNYHSRVVEKIIQIHDDKISAFLVAPNGSFYVTAAQSGMLRIWTTDFETLKSEVNTGNEITHCDVNYDCNQICVLCAPSGTISVLDLEHSSYNVVMRSHMDNVTDIAYNQMTGKLVSVAEDYCVKVWHAESMEQINEFVSENDKPIRVVSQNQGLLGEGITSEDTDSLVAIGFKSGFLRILDLNLMKIVHETMLFQSPVMDIEFSLDNRFMAVFFKSGKIVIINKERAGEFLPVKNIDYELPNQNYCSLSFSMDSSLLANISSNANTITVWETRNFSLRYHLDVTGDIISKIQFAPNGKDLVLLTTSSKLKFYRLGSSARDTELMHIKDTYGITDLECLDFHISSNNKFIVCTSRQGTIVVFDYFMRGELVPSSQAFLGHFTHASRLIVSKDMRFVFSVGELNGIYKWLFYGDSKHPDDITQFCEELEHERLAKAQLTEEEKDQLKVGEGMFDQGELMSYTQQQIDKFGKAALQGGHENDPAKGPDALAQLTKNPFQHSIDLNKGGYVYEQFELQLCKLLACSNGASVKNNLVWNEKQRYICFTVHNILVIEYLNQEKTQKLIKEGNDQIYQIKLSPSGRYLLAYSRTGPLDGFPCIFIFDSITFNKVNQIAISDGQIDSVEFSGLSNMLLVVSSTRQGEESLISTLTVWDYIDGHKDTFCKSMIPIPIKESAWNPYLEKNADEFVTISDRCYHYWRMTPELQLQYQEGDLPAKQAEGFRDKADMLTTLSFVRPDQMHHSVYMLLGLRSGYVWVTDTRVNQFLFNVKVLDDFAGGVNRIFSSHQRIIIEAANSPVLHSWDQSGRNGDKEYSAYNPFNFFVGLETTLSIDGTIKSSSYDHDGGQLMVLSSSGSIWYLSWADNATLRLKYCHNPVETIKCADFKYVSPNEFRLTEEQDQEYVFDQNYQVTTASSDGQIKLWNMHDLEYCQQFIVPKEECIYIAMHQFKPFMVCSFTDGYLRFFDMNASKLLGRCKINSGLDDRDPKAKEGEAMVDYAVSIKILPSGNHMFAATKNGQIVLIFVENWDPLGIKIQPVVSVQTAVNAFEFSYLEPYNKWLVATCNGKVIVYNRKDFNSLNQEIFDSLKPPEFNYMDSFNLQDFAANNYSQTRRCNTLDHYYSMAKRNLVYNEVGIQHECEGVFANNDLTLHMSFIRQCNQIFIRNFELHQVVKRIEISQSTLPRTMQLMPGCPFICITLKDNSFKLIDYMNEANQAQIQTLHQELTAMKVCPNGRYVLTAGNRGDVCLWNVNKKILGPEEMNQALSNPQ